MKWPCVLKPGSHMLPSYLPSYLLLFRYEKRSGSQQMPSESLLPAYLWSWLEFDFAGMLVVKTCDVSCCRQCYVLVCWSSIAGSTSSYITGILVAYEKLPGLRVTSLGEVVKLIIITSSVIDKYTMCMLYSRKLCWSPIQCHVTCYLFEQY